MVVIISKYVSVSNEHIVHLKFIQCYMSAQQSWKKILVVYIQDLLKVFQIDPKIGIIHRKLPNWHYVVFK